MNPLYNFGIRAYSLAVRAVSFKHEKAKKMLIGQRATFETLAKELDSSKKYVWVHVSSLGEFEQGRPLIEKLRKERPDLSVVLSFFSPSGYEVRKNYDKADIVVYLPFDTPKNAEKFVKMVNPVMAIFVKYEFWGNYLSALKRQGIPTYLISSIFRKGQIFFKPWGETFRNILRCYTRLYLQDSDSQKLLSEIGITNTVVAGDTRFDRVTDILSHIKSVPQAELLSKHSGLTLVAGSTWHADEKFILPYFNSHKNLRLIIAPHEVNEERVQSIISNIASDRKVLRLSQAESVEVSDFDCLIVDCFGLLSSVYHYGDIAYIGGGFGAGIHNINEAAVHSIPVVFGPNNAKFKEASDLQILGGGFSFSTEDEFLEIFDKLTTDESLLKNSGKIAGNYIKKNIGATELIFKDLFC